MPQGVASVVAELSQFAEHAHVSPARVLYGHCSNHGGNLAHAETYCMMAGKSELHGHAWFGPAADPEDYERPSFPGALGHAVLRAGRRSSSISGRLLDATSRSKRAQRARSAVVGRCCRLSGGSESECCAFRFPHVGS